MSIPRDTKPILDKVAELLRAVDEEGADPVDAINSIFAAVAPGVAELMPRPVAPRIIDDGWPAFPFEGDANWKHVRGRSLRDWFAGQALAGAFACGTMIWRDTPRFEDLVSKCYLVADAMIAERKGSTR